MTRIEELLSSLKDTGGSDLHLIAGSQPRMRIKGALVPIPNESAMDDARLRELMAEIVSTEQWEEFDACGDLDFAHGLPGVARFRGNYLKQENGVAAVFRIIPEEILTCEQLGLPEAIASRAARCRAGVPGRAVSAAS